MQVQNSTNTALSAFKQNQSVNANNQNDKNSVEEKSQEKSLEQTINDSAVSVAISMNAQYILIAMNASSVTEGNTLTQASLSGNQRDVLDFLSGKETQNGMSLKNIGYEGKPITELTQDEAKELVSEDGFFGMVIGYEPYEYNFKSNTIEFLINIFVSIHKCQKARNSKVKFKFSLTTYEGR